MPGALSSNSSAAKTKTYQLGREDDTADVSEQGAGDNQPKRRKGLLASTIRIEFIVIWFLALGLWRPIHHGRSVWQGWGEGNRRGWGSHLFQGLTPKDLPLGLTS
jgi:hypothetical protein